ncbi:MAG TPA: VCBS repeat-containing protein, partial [Candidatus Marinimicrobia bacterium]|nr:VCBS repeat-containing protein [Candidatus Neomarinimicrobiota bacterium]
MKIRISCIISLSLSGLFGKDNFSITEFSLPSEISTVFIEDWNGNGRRDILVLTDSLWYIYFQSHDGWKTKNADLVFPPPQAAIVYDFGNVDDDPDNELVYFSTAGVFKVKIGSPNSEPILLFKTKTLFDQFHDSLSKKEDGFSGKRFTFLMEFKKGKTDIVVPTLEGFEIWERNETFQFSHKLGGVGSREIKSYNAVGISGVYTINNYRLIDVNKDGEKEFIFNNDDHFSIYLKNPSTQSPERLDIPFPETLLKKNKKEKPATITKLEDINNEGVVDIVARKIATQSLFSFRTHIQTYFGAMDTSQFPPIL